MILARAPRARRRRHATRAPLRALATLVAVLVGLSSFGQFAHFLLVPHAICAEHGELLELNEQDEHAVSHVNASAEGSEHAATALVEEHDHCQVLARGQREQAEPTPATFALSTCADSAEELAIVGGAAVVSLVPALSLAPKTSPPVALAG
jgi:hypothetical protein